MSSSKQNERIVQLERIMFVDNQAINMEELRNTCVYGISDSLRPICWRLLLGYLTKERQKWKEILPQLRHEYESLVNNFTAYPSFSAKNEAYNANSVVEECVTDHPLATSSSEGTTEKTVWEIYFEDNKLIEVINRDVKRLRPEMGFFQRKNKFPKSWSEKASLLDRIVPRRDDSEETPIEKNKPFEEMHWHVIQRILFIYAKANPGIKYVQGLHELLGPIYFVFASDPDVEWSQHAEADSFYCFQNLLTEIKDNFISVLDSSNVGMNAILNQFYEKVAETDPELYNLFIELKIKPQYFAYRWLSVLLCMEFSLPDTIQLWDNIFSSSKRMERAQNIGLAMLQEIRSQLFKGDYMENIKLLQNYPTDCEVFPLITYATKLELGTLDAHTEQSTMSAFGRKFKSKMSELVLKYYQSKDDSKSKNEPKSSKEDPNQQK